VSGRPMPIEVQLPDNCSNDAPPEPVFDGRAWTSGWVTTCPGGLIGGELTINGLERTRTETLIRYELNPEEVRVERLTPSNTSFAIEPDAGSFDVLASYTALGITHILEGLDHLLFVFALLLLIEGRARLFWAITAFTLAHSITLAASTFGWLRIAPPPVEAVIALSIVFLAYELTLPPERRDQIAVRFPWIVSFGFGLIHGLGFAGALREIGLPEGDIPLALFSFNVGVELGQILFIAGVLITGTVIGNLYPKVFRHTGMLRRMSSYGIGTLAAFWVIERVAAF
ncbi:MAG: HupE/UreJ family protein, partial [Chloroflexota bacterium]